MNTKKMQATQDTAVQGKTRPLQPGAQEPRCAPRQPSACDKPRCGKPWEGRQG